MELEKLHRAIGHLLRMVCNVQHGTVGPPSSVCTSAMVVITSHTQKLGQLHQGNPKSAQSGESPMRKLGMKPMEDRNLDVKMFGMEHSHGAKLCSNLQGSWYHPPMVKGHSLLFSFNRALLPAVRTNKHFNRSDTALYISAALAKAPVTHYLPQAGEFTKSGLFWVKQGWFQLSWGHPCQLPSLLHNRERKGTSISGTQAESSRSSTRKETGGRWWATMESQLHRTSRRVQACVKGCKQPEPINFYIPFPSDLETKRVAFSTGHTVQGEEKKNDSAISKFREEAWGTDLKRWISIGFRWWREGGISAPLICAAWLKSAWALALHRNGNCLIGCECYKGKNPAVMQATSLLRTFYDLPADWTFLYWLIVDVIDVGGKRGAVWRWGRICIWWQCVG